jgi:hypothetical protein
MKDFGSISLYIDKRDRSNSLPINILRRKPYIWIPDHKVRKCFKCNIEFGIINRKHHCRICGRIFCSSCSKWKCKSNSYISLINSPNEKNTLNKFINKCKEYYNTNIRLCSECFKHNNIVNNEKNNIIIMSNIPLTIIELLRIRSVSKIWCKTINYLISIYRSIQYKLPSEKFSSLERIFLWNHRYEFKDHYYFITKCLVSNNDRDIKDINKLINYYKKGKHTHTCKSLLCRRDCKNLCKAEDILEIGFNINLEKYISIQKFIIELLVKKTKTFFNLLLPWIIQLSKKYYSFGILLCEKCNDIVSVYNIYFELKYNLNFEYSDNLKKIYDFLNKEKLNRDLKYDLRKTSEFIKLIKLVILKKKELRYSIIEQWFIENISVRLPWNPNIVCTSININNIKQLDSSSKPWVIPLMVYNDTNNYIGTKYILIKNEDVRKDKLTMCISKWVSIICNKNIFINTYNVLPISLDYGWVEMIDNCNTLYDIKHIHKKTLQNYIMDINPNITINELRNNFIKTCVSSCVLCYILGVGDRHTENVLLNKNGDLVHIDFSYILGEDPKNNNIEMMITNEMLEILGGKKSNTFVKFKSYCVNTYKKIRRHSSLWYILLTYLSFSTPPIDNYYNNEEIIKHHIIERLIPGEIDDESRIQMLDIVDKSSEDNILNTIYEYSHVLSKSIKKIPQYLPIFKMD